MGNYVFRRITDEDLGIKRENISSVDLLKRLLDEWNIRGRKEDIEDTYKILTLLRKGESAIKSFYGSDVFGTTNNINDLADGVSFEEAIDSSLGFHVDIGTSHTTRRLEKNHEFDYQYRISINNDARISYNDIILFTSKFEELCKERDLPLNIKVIPDERDVFICYCKDENIPQYVQILMDMRNYDIVSDKVSEITDKFGSKKPFTGSVKRGAYFGVSSGLFKNEEASMIKGRAPADDTMTSYSAKLAENAYKILLEKNKGDVSRITVEDLYLEMHKEHARRQFPDRVQKGSLFRKERIPSELLDIPFWMNEHAYNMVYGNNLDRGTRGR